MSEIIRSIYSGDITENEALEHMKDKFRKAAFYEVLAGDEITLPDGTVYTMQSGYSFYVFCTSYEAIFGEPPALYDDFSSTRLAADEAEAQPPALVTEQQFIMMMIGEMEKPQTGREVKLSNTMTNLLYKYFGTLRQPEFVEGEI